MTDTANGPFKALIKEFVDFKQATGYKYQKEYSILKQFDDYCIQQQITKAVLTKNISDGWCKRQPYEKPRTNDQRITVLRQFAFYLVSMGYDAYIPVHTEDKRSHKSKYAAYIFTHDEIAKIIECSDKIYPNRRSTMHLVMPVLVRLLYSTGLRIMEALNLQLKHIDLADGIIRIEHAKFDKDRLIPVSTSMLGVCACNTF